MRILSDEEQLKVLEKSAKYESNADPYDAICEAQAKLTAQEYQEKIDSLIKEVEEGLGILKDTPTVIDWWQKYIKPKYQ